MLPRHNLREWVPGQKSNSFYESLRYALDGVASAFRTERNVRIDFYATALCCLFNLIVRPTVPYVCLSLVTCSLVIGAELLNTSIENLTDLVVRNQYHPVAKRVKDTSAGFVLLVTFGAMAVGAFIVYRTWPWHPWVFRTQQLLGVGLDLVALCILTGIVLRSRSVDAEQASREI